RLPRPRRLDRALRRARPARARAPRLVRDARTGPQHRDPRSHRLPDARRRSGTGDAGRRQPARRLAARTDEQPVTATTIAVLRDDTRAPLLAGLDLGGAAVLVVTDAAWRNRLAAATSAIPAVPVHQDDLWVLIFTSGSTGAPKAVRMTQGRAARAATSSTW